MIELVSLGVVQVYNADEKSYRHIYPKTKVDGKWQDTDISDETDEVKKFCTDSWSDSVKDAYTAHIDLNLVE